MASVFWTAAWSPGLARPLASLPWALREIDSRLDVEDELKTMLKPVKTQGNARRLCVFLMLLTDSRANGAPS